MQHTIDANTAERKASEVERYGERYYPVDKTYDKRVYENEWSNIAIIIGVLFLFWIANGLHWWGIFCFGIVNADGLVWYGITCFFFTIFFLGGLLWSGKYANKMKRQHEFLLEKIAERKSELQEVETKKEQEDAHEKKLAAQAGKLAAAQREQEAAAADVAPATNPGFVANIQDVQSDRRLIQADTRA